MIDDESRLLRDEMILAEDVEDFQVAFFFDVNGDGDYSDDGRRSRLER